MNLVELQKLTVLQGTRAVLDSINLQVNAGEMIAVVGPNGAGKSTLLQHLAGISPITQGQLSVQQQATATWQSQEWAQHVSFLPQLSRLTFPLTVQEVVRLGGLSAAVTQQQLNQLTVQALAQWQLQDFASRDVRKLSGGEQQRVQLARTWLQLQAPSCQLWLLDEPFSALDLRHQQQCLQHIKTAKQQGKGIIIVVHDLNFARHCADRVVMLKQGQLVASGQAAEVLSAQQVSEVFEVATQLQGEHLFWW